MYTYIFICMRASTSLVSQHSPITKIHKNKNKFSCFVCARQMGKESQRANQNSTSKKQRNSAAAQEEMKKNWNGEIGKRRWVKEKAMHTLKQHLHRSESSFFFVAFFAVASTAVMAVAVADYLHFLQNTIKKTIQLKAVCSVYINPLAQKCYRSSVARFVAVWVFAISCLQCLPSTSAHFERCSLILLFSAAETHFRIYPL